MSGNVEQQGILVITLHAAMHIGQRVVKIVRYVFIELVVPLLGNLAFWARPEGGGAVDHFVFVLFVFFL